jgi:cytochrome c
VTNLHLQVRQLGGGLLKLYNFTALLSGIAVAFVAECTFAPSIAFAGDIDLEAAHKQFLTSCGTCHVADDTGKHRQGPNLYAIFGSKSGQAKDFKYSEGLIAANLVYDAATLDAWLENPKNLVAGTNMAYKQKDPAKRALVIAYLQSLAPKP